jgi:hypothetical protein
MRVEFVPGLRRRPKKKTIDHEDKRISENTLNPLRFFPCDVYISAGFLSDDCGGYCPAQVAKLEGRMKFIVSPQLLLLSICMKTLDRYGQYFTVRATFPRGPFNGASRCHCY